MILTEEEVLEVAEAASIELQNLPLDNIIIIDDEQSENKFD